jgi:hypothetical protein
MLRKIFLVALAALLVGCTPTATPTPARSTQKATKGMELYSWKEEAGDWRFALLLGTNRSKAASEVIAKATDLEGIKATLSRLAVGEEVFWTDRVNPGTGDGVDFRLPPDDLLQAVKKTAEEYQLQLHVLGE